MKYVFILALTLSVTPIWGQQYQVVCTGFYNLENLFDTLATPGVNDIEFTPDGTRKWTGKRYQDKLQNLAKVIGELGMEFTKDGVAILGVSELENRSVLEDLVVQEALADRGYKIVHYDSPDRRGIDVALIYQPRYFEVVSSQSVNSDIFNLDGEEVITRDVLHVHGLLHGQELHILVNHWPSRRGGEKASRSLRVAAAKKNRQIIDSIWAVSPDAGILVMGDFNDNPVNESVRKGIKTVPDKERAKKGLFYNPWHNYYKKGLGTLAWQDTWSLFDQVLISHTLIEKRDDNFYYWKSAIHNPPYLIQPMGHYRGYPFRTFDFDEYISGYSDHFPVVSYFVKAMEN